MTKSNQEQSHSFCMGAPLYRELKRDRFKQNSNLERLKPSHKKGVGILTKIESGKMENPHIRN